MYWGDFFDILNIFDLILFKWNAKFQKRKANRRRYEKKNNLPKKIMISPSSYFMIFIVSIALLIWLLLKLDSIYLSKKKTVRKLQDITAILSKEKNDLGYFPDSLYVIKRNNPFRKNIDIDGWDNKFYYQKTIDSYILISKGKDGILNTEDDIELGN